MRKQTIKALKKKTWAVFSIYIRHRDCFLATGSPDYGECITCGDPFEFRELQAGHFTPKHSGNYFSERGVHAQCRTCNLYGKDKEAAGMPLTYRRKIVKLYGKGADLKLEAEARQTKTFTMQELEYLITYYREKIKELGG